METMRDAFFNALFPLAQADPAIMVLTSDFSAPSFDRYRAALPNNFINTGISEQNTILVGSGLAMSGMKVFVVSIAPFITMRCFEQIRLFPADMKLNVTIVGIGAGFSYSEAGATHHSVEDIGLMRLLPNMRIFSVSDNTQVHHVVGRIMEQGGPAYVRLDRRSLPTLYADAATFGKSLALLSPIHKINFIATGYATHRAKDLSHILNESGIETGVVDAFALPLDPQEFLKVFSETEYLVSLEEHITAGGLGEAISHIIRSSGSPLHLSTFSLNLRHGLCHSYGSRDVLHSRHGLNSSTIMETVKQFHTVLY